MKIRHSLMVSAAIIALAGCGEKGADEPSTKTSREAAQISAGSPLDSDFRLKDSAPVDADEILALFPPRARPTYESADFDDNLGATVLTNLRFADDDDGEAVVIKRAEFFGVDLEAINRLKAASADDGDTFETVFQKVRLLDISSEGFEEEDAKVDLTIGGIELDNLKIKPGVLGAENDNPFHIFDAVNLAGAYVKDFSMITEEDDVASVNFSAPDLRVVGFGGGKIDAILATDLAYDIAQGEETIRQIEEAMGASGAAVLAGPLKSIFAPDSQQMKMKTFEWRGIDFSNALPFALREERPPASEKNLIDLGEMRMTDAEAFINDKRASMMKEVSVSPMKFTWLVPSDIRMEIKDAVYDYTAYAPEGEDELQEILKSHGLDKVSGAGFSQWTWSDKSGKASFVQEATTDGLADLLINFNAGGLPLEKLVAAIDDADDEIFADVTLNNFELTIADEKALDAIFDVAALQMGGTGEDLRLSIPAMIRISGLQVAQINPRISGYVEAVAEFIGKGGTISIKAEPEKPLALGALDTIDPTTLPDVINLTVTHKE